MLVLLSTVLIFSIQLASANEFTDNDIEDLYVGLVTAEDILVSRLIVIDDYI